MCEFLCGVPGRDLNPRPLDRKSTLYQQHHNATHRHLGLIIGRATCIKLLRHACVADGTVDSFQMNIPRINTEYVGSGDLFAALLLAWMHQHPHDLKVAH